MRKPGDPVAEVGKEDELPAAAGATQGNAPTFQARSPGPFPLSPEQEGIWYLEEAASGTSAYNVTGVLSLPADVAADAVGAALEQLAARHESLRTVFETHDGRPEQRVRPTPAVDFAVLPTAADREQALDQLSLSGMEVFRLAAGPLLRARLIRAGISANVDGPREQLLGLTVHHLICDDWSWNLIAAELEILIAAAASGEPDRRAEPSFRYSDYVAGRQREEDPARIASAVDFWRDQLGTPPPVLDLPILRTRPPVQTHRGAVRRYTLPQAATRRLAEFCQRYGVTTDMTVLTAFGTVMSNAAYQDQVVIGTERAGRDRPEFEHVVGLFARTHAFRLDFSGTPSFADAVQRVKDLLLSARPHQHISFAGLANAVQDEHDPSRTPVFQVMVRTPPAEPLGTRRLLLRAVDLIDPARERQQPVKFDLTLVAREVDGTLAAELEYDASLFEPGEVDAMGLRLIELLAEGTQTPDRPAALLASSPAHPFASPLPASDQPRVSVEFTRWATGTPRNQAVRLPGGHVSYEKLARTVGAIAEALPVRGIVALVGGKHLSSVATLMAGIFAGSVVVPIDEKLPAARQREMATLAGATVVFHAGPGETPAWAGELGLPVRRVTGQEDTPSPSVSARQAPPPEAPAYIFFTSGTAGAPKAVRGDHRGLDHFAAWERSEFSIAPGDRVAQLTTLSFDAVLRDIFVPLSAGATVCLPPPNVTDDVLRLLEWMAAEKVTVVHTTPSILGSWLSLGREARGIDLSRLRLVCLAGEQLTGALVRRFRAVFPDCPAEMVNFYGPTETTMIKTFFRIPGAVSTGVQPIGQPLPGTQLALLGVGGRLCGPGERGEIVIRTPYRAQYLVPEPGDGFRPNPHTGRDDDVLYYTGDLGVQTPDGGIVLTGRRDGLIKVHGIRIHPAEVTTAVVDHPDVAAAHVEALRGDGQTTLAAFVVRRPGADLTADALRSYLTERLGAKAPSRVLFLDRFPLLPNGKINRHALISLGEQESSASGCIEPSTETEAALMRIWKATLQRERLSVDDDFFTVGGHSLLATILLMRIRKELGAELSLRNLLEAPRIDHLAQAIDRMNSTSQEAQATALVTLRPGDRDKEPCFIIHPISGDITCYRTLASKVQTDRAIYAYPAPGLQSGSGYGDLREMAAAYLHEIRTVQPHGPYRFAGWSFGGLIAFEIARQLIFDDEKVVSLILLDTCAPGSRAYEEFGASREERSQAFARDLRYMSDPLEDEEIELLLEPVKENESERITDLRRRFEVFCANSGAVARYRGRRSYLPGTHVVLVRAGAQERPEGMSPALDWEQLLDQPPECVQIPGADHYSLLTPPVVDKVAAMISNWLR